MAATVDFAKKQLVKLEKRVQAALTLKKEATESLEKANETLSGLQYEAVALRTLAAGNNIPKEARSSIAEQFAELLSVPYDETSVMAIIAQYDEQDEEEGVTAISKPTAAKKTDKEKPAAKAKVEEISDTEEKPKRRGRPKLTPEQKAERAKQRAEAAAAAARAKDEEAEADGEDDVVDAVDEMEGNFGDMDDEYFDPDEFGEED